MSLEAVTAGYFGVVPSRPPSWLDDRYVGASLLSLDRELVAMVPGPAWTTSSVDVDLAKVGVPESDVSAATAWLDEAWRRGDVLYPNVFRAPSVLDDFLDRFAPESPVVIIGAALDGDDLDGFLSDHDAQIRRRDGIIDLLRRAEPLAPGYRRLGYEPVEVAVGGFGTSWTVQGLQPAVEAATGVVPNGDGFVSTRDEARAVMGYLWQPDVPKEPGLWRAWQIVSYPRHPPRSSDSGRS